ncbi:hypothetical protein MTO96_019824 [Rhipicephalus appendiculatus]
MRKLAGRRPRRMKSDRYCARVDELSAALGGKKPGRIPEEKISSQCDCIARRNTSGERRFPCKPRELRQSGLSGVALKLALRPTPRVPEGRSTVRSAALRRSTEPLSPAAAVSRPAPGSSIALLGVAATEESQSNAGRAIRNHSDCDQDASWLDYLEVATNLVHRRRSAFALHSAPSARRVGRAPPVLFASLVASHFCAEPLGVSTSLHLCQGYVIHFFRFLRLRRRRRPLCEGRNTGHLTAV